MIFNLSGGGSGLNLSIRRFSTVDGLLAASPRENTVGIVSETDISGYLVSRDTPETPAEGFLWILTGTSGKNVLSLRRKNPVMLYPLLARQYVGGVWTEVQAYIRRAEQWEPWWDGRLYAPGDSAGWSYVKMGFSSALPESAEPTVDCGDSAMEVTGKATSGAAWVYDEEIDLTDYETLTLDGTLVTGMTVYPQCASLNIWSEIGTYADDNLIARKQAGDTDMTIDVSRLAGKARIGFFIYDTSSTVTVNELKLTAKEADNGV